MKIVVSGASGFLGGHTLSLLRRSGLDAIGTSRSQHNSNLGIQKINSLQDMPDADTLIHFAESNNRSEVNQLGRVYVEEVKKRIEFLSQKYGRMIYVSSVAVYPEGSTSLRSPAETLESFDTYSETKLAAEKIVLTTNKNPLVARIGNAYGPKMSELNVVSSVIRQFATKKNKIELVSTDPIRDYVWCEDIAEAFLKISTSQANGVYNVATGIGHSVLDLCRIAEKVTNHTNYELVTQKRIPDSSIVLDISKTTKDFNWNPKMKVEQGFSILIKEKSN